MFYVCKFIKRRLAQNTADQTKTTDHKSESIWRLGQVINQEVIHRLLSASPEFVRSADYVGMHDGNVAMGQVHIWEVRYLSVRQGWLARWNLQSVFRRQLRQEAFVDKENLVVICYLLISVNVPTVTLRPSNHPSPSASCKSKLLECYIFQRQMSWTACGHTCSNESSTNLNYVVLAELQSMFIV